MSSQYSHCIYSLILRNRNPTVKQGGTVEIEIFLSGYGIPNKNKLVIQWSSPYIIDVKNPGNLTSSIAATGDKVTGEIKGVVTGKKYLDSHKIGIIGMTINLVIGFFMDNPNFENVPNGLMGIISEDEWDKEPPLLLKVNTAKNAPPGDYDITFAFTYSDSQNFYQDHKTVQFHISSWWERNQAWITIGATIVAFLALIMTAIGAIWQILHWRIP